MNNSNKIIFKRTDYRSDEEFYTSILNQFRILIESKHVFSFHENPEIPGVYAVQFGSSEINTTGSYPVWLTADEILCVQSYVKERDYHQAQDLVNKGEEDDDEDDWDIPKDIKKVS